MKREGGEEGETLLVVAETRQVDLLEGGLLKCFTRHIAIRPPTHLQRSDMLRVREAGVVS